MPFVQMYRQPWPFFFSPRYGRGQTSGYQSKQRMVQPNPALTPAQVARARARALPAELRNVAATTPTGPVVVAGAVRRNPPDCGWDGTGASAQWCCVTIEGVVFCLSQDKLPPGTPPPPGASAPGPGNYAPPARGPRAVAVQRGALAVNPDNCSWKDIPGKGKMWCCTNDHGTGFCVPPDLLPPGTPVPERAPGMSFAPPSSSATPNPSGRLRRN
jgi:hypothetical protein